MKDSIVNPAQSLVTQAIESNGDTTHVIVGADVGRSFGVSVLRVHDPLAAANPRLIDVQQRPAVEALHYIAQLVESWKSSGYHVIIAAERFVNLGGSHRTDMSETPQYLGALTRIASELDVPMVKQNTSDAKRAARNDTLRQFNLYTTARQLRQPDANDANDATRHAFWYFMTQYPHRYDEARRAIGI